ncbi:NUDIX hydrolase [Crateriforma conspicua]|uniref:GDP-mannose pyrophosphatase n=1 Tax=Crateriforma conspicua TaxID=2527996 RepID=A0A5C5Y6Y9_9PLAN|nr:NUDIX hydrolase [Crateriforma conspicua]TWT69162.1 ADP-ribose pyrophosphatase [Crateriforma conspicua]
MQKKSDEKQLLAGNRFDVHAMELVGSDGKTYIREVVRHPGAVLLLPILDNGDVVMIENYRPTIDQTLLELPAGTREPGEPPEITAERELVEETGYAAGKLQHLHTYFSAPGICDEQMFLFLATDLTAGDAQREAVEQIENRVVPIDQAMQMIRDGQILDAKTIVGLSLYQMMPPTT